MKETIITHSASDGVNIFVRQWRTDEEPKAYLLIAHGVAEHSKRYERLAKDLTDGGYEVWAPDHRGHGETAAASGGRGWFAAKDGFRRVVDDLKEIRDRMVSERPELPVFLLGHSMGSSLARAYIELYGDGLAGCVLSGIVALDPFLQSIAGIVVKVGRAVQGGHGIAKFADGMSLGSYGKSFKPLRTPVDWLSRDTSVVDEYIADPDCGFTCTWDWYRDMNEGTRFILDPASVLRIPKNLPVYIFSGSEDPVGAASGGVEKLAQSYASAGLRDVETRLYPGGRHESLNEINRDEVVRDLLVWLDARRNGKAGAP